MHFLNKNQTKCPLISFRITWFMMLLLVAAVIGCRSNAPPRGEGSVVLTWDAPVGNRTGKADLAGYKIYYGNTSQKHDRIIKIPLDSPELMCRKSDGQERTAGRTICSYTVQGLDTGTHYFAITSYDASGAESVFSNEVSK